MVPVILQIRIGSLHLSGKSAHLVSILSILEHIIIRLQQVLEIELFRSTKTILEQTLLTLRLQKNLMCPCFAISCLL